MQKLYTRICLALLLHETLTKLFHGGIIPFQFDLHQVAVLVIAVLICLDVPISVGNLPRVYAVWTILALKRL